MDKIDENLRTAGFEPEKPVSCLTARQLYLLTRFAVGRTIIEKSNAEEHCSKFIESEDEKIRKWLIALIKSNEYGSISDVGEMPCPKLNVLAWLEKPIIDKEHIKSIVDYLLDYKLFIESEEYGNNAKSVQEEIDWLNNLK